MNPSIGYASAAVPPAPEREPLGLVFGRAHDHLNQIEMLVEELEARVHGRRPKEVTQTQVDAPFALTDVASGFDHRLSDTRARLSLLLNSL